MKRLVGLLAIVSQHALVAGEYLTSEVRLYKTMPALYVNGRLSSQMVYYCDNTDLYQEVLPARFPILQIPIEFGFKNPEEPKSSSTDWTDSDIYDFSRADRKISEVLRMDAQELLLPRISFSIGIWWYDAFPGDIVRRTDGQYAGTEDGQEYPSYMSASCRRIARGALEAFVRHLEASYGARMLGYQVAFGHYGEWFTWNISSDRYGRPREGVCDYSEAAVSRFRDWIRARYQNNEGSLAKAWGYPNHKFDRVRIPSESERKNRHWGIFFDPSISRAVLRNACG